MAYQFFVGLDWGTESHQMLMVNAERKVLETRAVPHSGPGLTSFVDWLWGFCGGDPGAVAVGIEVPRGSLVDVLVERGFHVYSINPKQLDRFRDRHTVAGAKDDRRDAFVLADSLRSDLELYRRVKMDDPYIIRVRERSHMDEDLGTERARLCNQLRDALHRYYPNVLQLNPAADERWLWSLVTLAPTPSQGAKLTDRSLRVLLREHRIRRLSVEDVAAALRVPAIFVAPGTVEAVSQRVLGLVALLKVVDSQYRDNLSALERLLHELGKDSSQSEHRGDVRILQSLPGLGRQGIATMLAEAPQALAERDYHALRLRSGVAPVTSQTGKQGKARGKHPRVGMRRACNPRLREALFHWARVASMTDDHTKLHFRSLTARGHTYGRALRGVADRLLACLIGTLKSGKTYDPARRRPATQRLASTEDRGNQ